MRVIPALVVALVASAPPVAAQDGPWYAVEVIVFEHRADASAGDEVFPRDPGRPDIDAAQRVVAPTTPPSLRAFAQLPPESLQMGGAWRTLGESSRYRPLVHVGWIQPGLGPDAAVPVVIDLSAGTPLPPEPLISEEAVEDALPDDAVADDEPPVLDDEADADDLPPAEEINPYWAAEILRAEHPVEPVPERVSGTVTLLLQRFLHLGVDLVLTTDEPLPREDGDVDWRRAREDILADLSFGVIGTDEARARLDALDARARFESYRLTEQRRVRTTELHYFDHPRFGVVATVREVEQPTPEPEPDVTP